MPKVLVVEDDQSLCELLAAALERQGLEVQCTDAAEPATALLADTHFDTVVLDLLLRGSSGLQVIDAIKRMNDAQRPRVIVMTGADADIMRDIDRNVVKTVMFKPLDIAMFAPFVRAEAERNPAVLGR